LGSSPRRVFVLPGLRLALRFTLGLRGTLNFSENALLLSLMV
jgi:hypothetical protein